MDDDLFNWYRRRRESRADQILRRFGRFFLSNPIVWQLFKKFTFMLINRGFRHYGAGAVFERMRWDINLDTVSEDGLKLSNDFRAYYARMFHAAYPEHDGFFRNRKRPSEDRPGFMDDGSTFVGPEPPGPTEVKLMEQLRELLRKMENQNGESESK